MVVMFKDLLMSTHLGVKTSGFAICVCVHGAWAVFKDLLLDTFKIKFGKKMKKQCTLIAFVVVTFSFIFHRDTSASEKL